MRMAGVSDTPACTSTTAAAVFGWSAVTEGEAAGWAERMVREEWLPLRRRDRRDG
jgi:hypothetical protein